MKVKLIALFIVLWMAKLHSQSATVLDKKMDFSIEKVTVSEALLALCEKADLSISFKSKLFQNSPPVSISYKNRSLKFLLSACLQNTEIGFEWEQRRIILFQKPPPVFTISGFVEDSLSGERLVAATVFDEISGRGTTTNEYGFYSLSIPRGKAVLNFSYLGFNSRTYSIHIRKNLHYNISLKSALTLQEIIVTDAKLNLQEGLSIEEGPNFASKTIKQMPALAGEPDIVRYFQTLSGVEAGAGNFGGIHVRGGGADQNLILLDGVPVYNAAHSLGLFSIFSGNMIKSAQLYKSKFPAKFGGRLSSVIDIQTKEGNDKKFEYGGGFSLFATNAFVEGPIQKEKSSFYISARRTHLDPLFNLATTNSDNAVGLTERFGYYYYDINAKINYRLSEKDRLYLSVYDGADNIHFSSIYDEDFVIGRPDSINRILNIQNSFLNINWGNTILSTRWNRLWNNKLFSNTTLTYSQFRFNLFTSNENEFADLDRAYSEVEQSYFDSDIQDIALKMDIDYVLNAKHHLKFGGGMLTRVFRPILRYQEFETEDYQLTYEAGYFERDTFFGEPNLYAGEFNFYFEDHIKLNKKLETTLGAHNAIFFSSNRAWFSFQPRLSLKYQWHKSFSTYTSFSRMGQFLHVLSPVGVSMPFDLWVPSTENVRPQNAWQTVFGMEWILPKDFRFATEVYYKKLNHLITYNSKVGGIIKGGQDFDWEDQVTIGEGWNRGFEVSLRRLKGKTTGNINYTYSKAERRFDGLSSDKRFPFRFNRDHVFKIGLSHEFSPKFNVFATWYYGSGQRTTIRVIEVYGDVSEVDLFDLEFGNTGPSLNNFRLPPTHRMDINFSFHWPKKNMDHYFSFGFMNVYNQRNTLFSVRHENINNPEESSTEDIPGLPIMPSLRYEVKF